MGVTSIEKARRWFAEDLRYCAGVRSKAVVEAFAAVPRERFLGPGPWRLRSPMGALPIAYWTTDDADPHHLYHDVLVAIDERRRLNNGQPSLWARLYDDLELRPGERVVHVGAGTGYYSAVLAELVGPEGYVAAIEVDPILAGRARENLVPWPQVDLLAADGFAHHPDPPANLIVVNAGVSSIPETWLDGLVPGGGRLLVPLTVGWDGGFLLVTRPTAPGDPWPVRFVSRTGIIPCVGGHHAEADARLATALTQSHPSSVQSLRRSPEPPDATCWLVGNNWWLSTEPGSPQMSALE